MESILFIKILKLLFVDNGSTDGDILSLYEEARAARVKLLSLTKHLIIHVPVIWELKQRPGEMLLFLNNDIEVTRPGLALGIGEAGDAHRCRSLWALKLVYPDGILQHAGVVIGMHICGTGISPWWRI
jgi:hypothetical protein